MSHDALTLIIAGVLLVAAFACDFVDRTNTADKIRHVIIGLLMARVFFQEFWP